ncbi:MAG: kinase [Novosphingobium sp.]|nr:kinase [Novosphingobium sp.]
MSKADPVVLEATEALAQDTLDQVSRRPIVLGICGAQGSGKSTLVTALAQDLEARGLRCAVLSLDDLYLTKSDRQRLASEVHPLLATRGPPGTHDVSLGLCVLEALFSGTPVKLPRFDKAGDDRLDPSGWPEIAGQFDIVLFEGWCLGARPQESEALALPVNALEAEEDPKGTWRRYVNQALAGPYQALFARIDKLVLLQAPGFEVVLDWRLEQEEGLRALSGSTSQLMDRAQIARFISHYERITRHILGEMPQWADLVIELDRQRKPLKVGKNDKAIS